MLDSPLLNVLQAGLDYSSARQEALSDNIANINTPGYQRRDASFDNVLAAAENSGDSSIFSLPSTADGGLETDDPRQISLADDSSENGVKIVADSSGAMRLDGNNVDMDVEMGRVAKNEIYYQGLTEILEGQFSNLKFVINGGGS